MIPVSAFAGRNVAVFGLGRTGLTAVRALEAGGARVSAWDDGEATRARAASEGVTLTDLNGVDFAQFDALVMSPGVPLYHPQAHWTVARAEGAGVPVIGDVELFARTLNALDDAVRPRVVAITGTNGKSTTTALIGHILSSCGKDTRVGGNIGLGVLGLAPPRAGAIYVLELSSFQLDLVQSLRANVAIHLNLTPDHLDRHGTMDRYAQAKRMIFQNQSVGDAAIVGVDDDNGESLCTRLMAGRGHVVPISSGQTLGKGVYALGTRLFDAIDGRAQQVADLTGALALRGAHNAQNAASAYAACRALGLSPKAICDAMLTFPGLPHRLEKVGEIGGVSFINDSKATNADAAAQALAAYPKLYWIAGGVPKAEGIEPLVRFFKKVECAYLIGDAAGAFAETIGTAAPHVTSGTLEAATKAALADASARGGEAIVLLSPACASFDQFKDYEARGDAFRAIVADLMAAAKAPTALEAIA